MTRLGIFHNQLTLDEGLCQFHKNQTHYNVRIEYQRRTCNSQMLEGENSTFIRNLVRVIPPSLLKIDSSDDEDGELPTRDINFGKSCYSNSSFES